MNKFDYDKWKDKYYNYKFINVKRYLNFIDIALLKKLDIEIQDKLYSNYEYDILEGKLIDYYRNEKEMTEEELKLSKPLDGTGVSRRRYNKLLNKFNKITDDYNI